MTMQTLRSICSRSFLPRCLRSRSVATAAMLIALGGCATTGDRVATDIPAEQAQPAYWYQQPAVVQVAHDSFEELARAAERAARDRFFQIDQVDYRSGAITTQPLQSRQAFELWRGDVVDGEALAESTLATVRRTIRFEFSENPDGEGYVVSPKVVVERRAIPERRVTDPSRYRATVTASPTQTRIDADGERLPSQYWYALGRDQALEQALAKDIQRLLSK